MKITREQIHALAAQIMADNEAHYQNVLKELQKEIKKLSNLTRVELKDLKKAVETLKKYDITQDDYFIKEAQEYKESKVTERLMKEVAVRAPHWSDREKIVQAITLATIDADSLEELTDNALALLNKRLS